MFERLDQDARQAVELALANSQRLEHRYVGTEHLLLGLVDQPETLSGHLLAERGLDKAAAEKMIVRLLEAGQSAAVERLDADALETLGIDLSAIRDRIEAAFGAGALDREPVLDRTGRLASGRTRFTPDLKKALELSLREALRLKDKQIGDGHLLLGLLREGRGIAAQVMVNAGLDLDSLRAAVEDTLASSRT
ncbi:MAG: Clp protease N-terminal domain-containing protein [Acidimicrobiales bacterium]